MATSLSQELRPASFRGVAFQVESTDLSAGRRNTLHEYPQRDQSWVEDLGRAARELNFEAFVVGSDYVAQANTLLAALEEAGPGTLIHPWFGTLTVSLKDTARINFNRALGFARFSLSFVEAGELTFPAASGATQSQSRLAADDIETAAVEDFADEFDVDDYQDFVATDALAEVTAAASLVASGQTSGLAALGFAQRLPNVLGNASGLLQDPQALGGLLADFLGVADFASDALDWLAIGQSLIRLASSSALAAPSAPAVLTPSRQQSYVNTQAVRAVHRQLLLAQAVGASSLIRADVYEDTVDLRRTLAAALDAESLQASDKAYAALQQARSVVWQDLTSRSREGARLMNKTPLEPVPAIVLAYDLYESAARDEEIVRRNRVRHPGFVPPVPLKVLTR
jgi:prophage DNA circulation protein